jgi:hypothetical protein
MSSSSLVRMDVESPPCSRRGTPTLRDVIHRSAIKPFTPQSLESYKRELAREIEPRLRFEREIARYFIEREPLMSRVLGWSCVGLLASVLSLALLTGPNDAPMNGSAMAALASIAFYGMIILYEVRISFFHLAVWQRTPIEKWAKPLPEPAALTMRTLLLRAEELQVKGVVCEVEWCEVKKVKDPFLVIRREQPGIPNEEFYVEVWDEPGFRLPRRSRLAFRGIDGA